MPGSLQLQSTAVSADRSLPPALVTPVPGPRSRALAERLARIESRNVTCLEPTAPIFWERAAGANVWDVDGNRFIDVTSAFAVANTGHGHPRVVSAVQDQADRLLHGMGDVHPPAVKVELLEELVRRYPGGVPARAVLSSSGSDAVETAIKTALLATGKPGIVAFEGGYHGLGFGALDATARPMFRDPFTARLPSATSFARFGDARDVGRAARTCREPLGAVLVEPIQGRGGDRIPPDGFLADLRRLCDEKGWLLIVDEVFTGFGRTGRWFACEHDAVIPDLLCVGKGMASGMPISACLGRAEIMDAWPPSRGEALHTQTFLGHPIGCAAALAAIAVIEGEKLVERSASNGAHALARLRERLQGRSEIADVRGRGLALAVECASPERAANACRRALENGVIALLSGDDGRVLSITPPLCIDREILEIAVDRIALALA
jgi:4-aminobutyrate aminotransferase/(S)-3-amino-2-methylpropionate transaminase